MNKLIGNKWDEILSEEFKSEYFVKLEDFLKKERENKVIFPQESDVFNALKLISPEKIKVVILGQDPYINPGEAHGLAFSVKSNSNVKVPPSLKNIFKEIFNDLGGELRKNGDLSDWAADGVLLLNTVLTVESGKSNSHAKQGWEKFTDFIIKYLGNEENSQRVFILWGKNAQSKEIFIDKNVNLVLKAAHPSPLSANSGFFGCKHFSQANKFLSENNKQIIKWQ